MDYFREIVEIVLGREGVLSNDKEDNGGLTKYGIAKASHPNLDIAKLTREQAIEIYRKEYWDPCRCGDLPWWAALLTFDAAVQHGCTPARKLLQETVGVVVDGQIGPKTLAAVAKADPVESTGTLQALRMLKIYIPHEDWKVYGKGWLRRSAILAYYAGQGVQHTTFQ